MRDFLLQSKALSDETRIRILKLLEKHELCVCQIMAILDLGQSTASKHIGILKNAGLIEGKKEGTWTFYHLADKTLNTYNLEFLEFIRNSLNNESLVRNDRKKLKEILKSDISTICIRGKSSK